eukprot:UN13922
MTIFQTLSTLTREKRSMMMYQKSGVKFAETVVVTHTLHTQTHSLDPPTSDLFWSDDSLNSGGDVILPVVVRSDEQEDSPPLENNKFEK